jgi:hypothetical protein
LDSDSVGTFSRNFFFLLILWNCLAVCASYISFSRQKQWEEGDDVPDSWKKYYQYNPCVPVDYSNIHTALSEVTGNAKKDSSKQRAIRVLLRPGRYVLRKAITIDESNTNCDENSNINNSVSVAIETMVYSPGNHCNGDLGNHSILPHPLSDQSKQKIKNSIRNIFRCRTVDVESEDDEDFVHHDSLNEYIDNQSLPSEEIYENANNGDREGRLIETPSGTHGTDHGRINRNNSVSVNRATLILTTRRHNEPLLRVRQGSITIRNIDLKHGSFGNGKSFVIKLDRRETFVSTFGTPLTFSILDQQIVIRHLEWQFSNSDPARTRTQ